MVEEVEVGASMSGSAAAASAAGSGIDARSSLPPRKRLLVSLMQNGLSSAGSALSASSVRLRKRTQELPSISDCHACGARMNKGGKDKLLTLDSEWRLVLLCKKCFDGVESAKICSYCFVGVSEDSVGCRECDRRIHKACILKYPGYSPCSNSGSVSFTCIDCWVPRPLANSNVACMSRNPSRDKILSDACSVENSRVSAPEASSKLLDDVVKDANSTAEKKIAAATLAREKAFTKAVAASRAAELARSALSLAVVAAREEKKVKDSPASCASIIDDAELALRLHRAINSSPRIAKNLCSLNSDSSHSPRLWHCNGNSLANASDPGSPSVCGKLEVCTENKLFENPDKAISEPSVRIAPSDHDSSTNLVALGENTKVEKDSKSQVKQCKDYGEDNVIASSKEVLKAGPLNKLDCKDDKVKLPIKEDEASCSNKFVKSSGGNNSTESGSQSSQKKNEWEYNNVGNMSQISCKGDSSMLKNKVCSESDRYLRKYSKRKSTLKAFPDCKFVFRYEDLPLESQASAPGLPCLQMNCSKVLRSFSDASIQSPSVPLQASVYESGPSGNHL